MLTPAYTTRFRKNLKKMCRRGKESTRIKEIMTMLINGIPLNNKHHDHQLIGEYVAHRECHIEPDWLLIYRISGDTIVFEDTGTHADLFE